VIFDKVSFSFVFTDILQGVLDCPISGLLARLATLLQLQKLYNSCTLPSFSNDADGTTGVPFHYPEVARKG
jgi:hypothetical protein